MDTALIARPETQPQEPAGGGAGLRTSLRREHVALKGPLLRELAKLKVFDADTAELAEAWERKRLSQIEELLKAGDALTRENWQRGIAIFNTGIACVDRARELTQETVARSEATLAPFDIDFARIKPRKSKIVAGYAPYATRKTFLLEKIDYGRSTGLLLGRMATGQTPWPVALIAVIGVGIWHLASRSKALRQLKEMEGKLILNAQAATGDFAVFRTLLKTRIVPQLKAVLDVMDDLEAGIAALEADADASDARKQAHKLARALIESRQLLETMAGN